MLEKYEEDVVEEYYTAVEENRALKWLKYIVYALSIMILLNMFLYTCSLMKVPRREEGYLQQSVVAGEDEYYGGAVYYQQPVATHVYHHNRGSHFGFWDYMIMRNIWDSGYRNRSYNRSTTVINNNYNTTNVNKTKNIKKNTTINKTTNVDKSNRIRSTSVKQEKVVKPVKVIKPTKVYKTSKPTHRATYKSSTGSYKPSRSTYRSRGRR